jgi:hypothetical protein
MSFSPVYSSEHTVNFTSDDVIHYMDTRNNWYIHDNYINIEGGKHVDNFKLYIKTTQGIAQVENAIQSLQRTFDAEKKRAEEVGGMPHFYSDDHYKEEILHDIASKWMTVKIIEFTPNDVILYMDTYTDWYNPYLQGKGSHHINGVKNYLRSDKGKALIQDKIDDMERTSRSDLAIPQHNEESIESHRQMNDEKRIIELALSHYLNKDHPLPFVDQVEFYIGGWGGRNHILEYLYGGEDGHNLDLTRAPTSEDVDAFVKALIYIINSDGHSFSLSYAQDFNDTTWNTIKSNNTAHGIHSEGHLDILFITIGMLIKKYWKQPVTEADIPSTFDAKTKSIIWHLYTKAKDAIKIHPYALYSKNN